LVHLKNDKYIDTKEVNILIQILKR